MSNKEDEQYYQYDVGEVKESTDLGGIGLRVRCVRLSVSTAIQFYDLQDRLGCDQPNNVVEWLLKAVASSIIELQSLEEFQDALMVYCSTGSRLPSIATTKSKVVDLFYSKEKHLSEKSSLEAKIVELEKNKSSELCCLPIGMHKLSNLRLLNIPTFDLESSIGQRFFQKFSSLEIINMMGGWLGSTSFDEILFASDLESSMLIGS
ncbi:hypothetical protein RDI58_026907 [Solanum bulbocastanum]|uniref:TCP domain-containing protein n=1 Tax=Solanum bulbocastanum TaxID=147425 RepID=A0AAN8SZV1_SOLBU